MANTLDLTPNELSEIYQYIQVILGGEDTDVALKKEEIQILLCKALKDYTYEINQWYIKNNYSNLAGFNASQDFTRKFITDNTMIAQRISDWFASMARVGGKTQWKKDYFTLQDNKQIYDLSQDSSKPYVPGERRIHRIMWVGTPEVVNSDLTNDLAYSSLFSFGQSGLSYANRSLSYLGNMFDVVLLMQSLETRNQILRSSFYYNISGDIVEISPMPGSMSLNIVPNSKCFYYYFDEQDFLGLDQKGQDGINELISNPTQIQLEVVPYSKLNSPAKNWIENYTLTLAKYAWGSKLRNIKSIASPSSEYQVEFDYASLIDESKTEKEALITAIRDSLAELDSDKLMAKKAEQVENAAKINRMSPRLWYLG